MAHTADKEAIVQQIILLEGACWIIRLSNLARDTLLWLMLLARSQMERVHRFLSRDDQRCIYRGHLHDLGLHIRLRWVHNAVTNSCHACIDQWTDVGWGRCSLHLSQRGRPLDLTCSQRLGSEALEWIIHVGQLCPFLHDSELSLSSFLLEWVLVDDLRVGPVDLVLKVKRIESASGTCLGESIAL